MLTKGQRPRWRIQREKTHLISTSMSCKGAKNYQAQDIRTCPLAFLVALGRLDLRSKETAARKVVLAVVPIVMGVDTWANSVPETADDLKGKAENAVGFRAGTEPEDAGSFGTRAELAEAGGFGAKKEPNKAGQTVLGPELSQRREVISWPGSSRRRQKVLQPRPNQRGPMFSWQRTGRPEVADGCTDEAGPAGAEPERSRSS